MCRPDTLGRMHVYFTAGRAVPCAGTPLLVWALDIACCISTEPREEPAP